MRDAGVTVVSFGKGAEPEPPPEDPLDDGRIDHT